MKREEGQVKDVTLSAYAVVWCREFRLQAVKRRRGRALPVALVDETKRQSVVLCCNALAAQRGVVPGIPTVQALARCPLLQVERPSAAAELAAGRTLLETALSWVPCIEESGPGILTLDLSTQLPWQWEESAICLVERLIVAGLEAVVGLGETPALARIAAQAALHSGKDLWHLPPQERLQRLDALPLLVAETGAGLNEKLRLWGVSTLGAFARLRREDVASRLGEEGVELWLRLSGRLRRPLTLAKWEELFEEHQEFEFDLTEREPLLFVVRRFIEQLTVRVAETGRAVTTVHLLVSFTDGSSYAKRLPMPEPTLDVEVLFRLVSGHLETFEMKAALTAVRLRFEPSDPVASQGHLFGAGLRNRHRYEETLTRLRKIVGVDRIGSPRRLDSHRPGSFVRVPLSPRLDDRAVQRSGPPVAGPILRKFPTSFRTTVHLHGGRPSRVESSRVSGVVTTASGPWKSGGDWWHCGLAWERKEWDVELLPHGLFRLVETAQGWILEGYYD